MNFSGAWQAKSVADDTGDLPDQEIGLSALPTSARIPGSTSSASLQGNVFFDVKPGHCVLIPFYTGYYAADTSDHHGFDGVFARDQDIGGEIHARVDASGQMHVEIDVSQGIVQGASTANPPCSNKWVFVAMRAKN